MATGDEILKPEIAIYDANRVEISWKPIKEFIVEKKINDGLWTEVGRMAGDQHNFSMNDCTGGVEYECRVIAVYEDGTHRLGKSKSFQIPSPPKILAPSTRQIPIQAALPTRLDVHYSGYPPPFMLWTDIDNKPLSNEIRCISSTAGANSISSLLIPPVRDGIQLKNLKFRIENSEGRDEAVFEFVVVQNQEIPNVPARGRKKRNRNRNKNVQDLQVTKFMGPEHEYVKLTWTPPKTWTYFVVQRRQITCTNVYTGKWANITQGTELKETEFCDRNVDVGFQYQYRIIVALPESGKTIYSQMTEAVIIAPKENQKRKYSQMEDNIEFESDGQNVDSAGPSGGQNTHERFSMKSEPSAKIIKTEMNNEEESD